MSDFFVRNLRSSTASESQLPDAAPPKRTGKDGKERAAHKRRIVTPKVKEEETGTEETTSEIRDEGRIAEACGVGADLVGDVRRQLSVSDSSTERVTRTGKDGKERAMPPPRARGSDLDSFGQICPNLC